MSKYLAGDPEAFLRALHNHAVNLEEAAAVWPLLAMLEIALRTSLNTQLELRSLQLGRKPHWALDPHNEIRRKNMRSARDLDQARDKLKRNHKSVTPARVIDELPLGFWTMLISKRFNYLWPDLVKGFKGLDSRDASELRDLLKFFRNFRNRVGHHHVIIFMDLELTKRKLFRLGFLIDPRLEPLLKEINRNQKLSIQTTQE
jgi:hypothetical protein